MASYMGQVDTAARRSSRERQPIESYPQPTRAQLHRRPRLSPAGAAEHRAGRGVQRRRVPPPRVSRPDRHAADGRRGAAVPGRRRGPIAATLLVDELARAAGVRRLLGAEMGRSAARRSAGAGPQGRVRLLPLDSRSAGRATSRWISWPARSSRPKVRWPSIPPANFYSRPCTSRARRRAQSRRCSSACGSSVPSATIIRSTAGARPTTSA